MPVFLIIYWPVRRAVRDSHSFRRRVVRISSGEGRPQKRTTKLDALWRNSLTPPKLVRRPGKGVRLAAELAD